MKNIKIIISLLWHIVMSGISPIYLGFCYMFFTGHGKDSSYDLRDEADIYLLIGIMAFVLWIIAVIPNAFWLGRTLYLKCKWMFLIPIILFIFCFILLILIIGFNF